MPLPPTIMTEKIRVHIAVARVTPWMPSAFPRNIDRNMLLTADIGATKD